MTKKNILKIIFFHSSSSIKISHVCLDGITTTYKCFGVTLKKFFLVKKKILKFLIKNIKIWIKKFKKVKKTTFICLAMAKVVPLYYEILCLLILRFVKKKIL